MALKRGSSRQTISSNIKKLVDEWKDGGAIGSSHPKTKQKAITQAAAIAYAKAGKSRKTARET